MYEPYGYKAWSILYDLKRIIPESPFPPDDGDLDGGRCKFCNAPSFCNSHALGCGWVAGMKALADLKELLKEKK